MLKRNINFFIPRSHFNKEEWVLKYQIKTMLLFSFFFAIGIFAFAFFRFLEGNYIVAISQLIFSTFSLYGFFKLRQDKKHYQTYAMSFFFLFFFYTAIIFFYVPENTLNILWVTSAPILIFFFLNRRGGIAMFLLIFSFIIYLIISNYHYNLSEYITLMAAFLLTSYIMYMYESLKEAEHRRLTHYNQQLQHEVEKKTLEVLELNSNLETRVQDEINRRHAQEQMLLCQNRMANMGLMIDSIAHQWKQPLMHINSILMNISRITETQPNNVQYVEDKVDDIFHITEHMSQTINDFRNLFQPQKEKSDFSLATMLNNVLTLTKGSMKEISIEMNEHKALNLHSYQNELSQVVLIVLHNAIEALEEKNKTTKIIKLTMYEDDTNLYIAIEDNAGGIQKELLEKIFTPYFSTKKKKEGTGLGLYIAKIIMEKSFQGDILVKNSEEGAIFTLVLPINS